MPYGGMLTTYSSVWAHWKDMDGKSFRILFGLYLIEEQPTNQAKGQICRLFCQSRRIISLATHLRGRRPGVKILNLKKWQ